MTEPRIRFRTTGSPDSRKAMSRTEIRQEDVGAIQPMNFRPND
ncbi:MAG TPA: hypothetical protein VF821_21745 [Lentzea sp.]